MSDPILMDVVEAAAKLDVKVSWLQRAVTANKVPHRRLGRKVRFTQSDLDSIVEQSAQATTVAASSLKPSKASKRT